ncbi:hypothetical protein F2P81_018076 [Scophthalmus maximus]|uniref:Uncharacterized protein n=1 Tax=Scophthalmus maximus TaxID=52904 RepID=A0A6A4SCZ7_SCOMX|nr:hypothetical protein F2P81_018076 [Scophthalmus maximus]
MERQGEERRGEEEEEEEERTLRTPSRRREEEEDEEEEQEVKAKDQAQREPIGGHTPISACSSFTSIRRGGGGEHDGEEEEVRVAIVTIEDESCPSEPFGEDHLETATRIARSGDGGDKEQEAEEEEEEVVEEEKCDEREEEEEDEENAEVTSLSLEQLSQHFLRVGVFHGGGGSWVTLNTSRRQTSRKSPLPPQLGTFACVAKPLPLFKAFFFLVMSFETFPNTPSFPEVTATTRDSKINRLIRRIDVIIRKK